ncbi:DoxX family protein [Spirosoma soli]|uniref:DoxX family protein n=1 Tax=Spirosoma soli TaxID=1770529 RepID=A0ABW5M4L8_9BACT
MKKTNITYWIFTGLFLFVMLGSAIPDLLVMPEAVEGFKQMGYPVYLIPFLGWAKLLGVIAILVPGFPRLKEWAYAGLIFDLIGATYSIINSGTPVTDWLPMLAFIGIGVGSYVFYHKKQKKASHNRVATEQLASLAS